MHCTIDQDGEKLKLHRHVVKIVIFCSMFMKWKFWILQQSFLEELERTVALLAFEDVKNCPYGELLDVSQRLKTASEVNAAILTSQSHEKGC